ncbi:MAG: peptide ABC transporter substrate-binding lipoprotein [Actinobacteria bacterium]|nr:peptide ABC transporter substrate-binding lipoprotein [Actinomycetota bacterium]MBM2827477.1 peptide transporter substrate-binding lipoprotein [Actinomycetota bacterium]
MRRPLLLLVVLAALAAGCSGEKREAPVKGDAGTQEAPAYGDALVEGSNGDVSGFLSAVTSDSASHGAANYIFNGLVRYDKNLKLEGELAESWEVAPDGRKITFRLRKNVKWHDNVPFTSDDVMFTYRKMIDPKTPTAYGEAFKQVRRVTNPDPYTVIVEYDKPYAPAMESWGLNILPKHLLEKYPDIKQSPLNKSHPIGTGPYKFIEWKPGAKIVFEANPDYFEGKPYIARVVTRVIPDQATMFLELKSGGIDQMTLTPLQYSKQTDTEEFRKNFRKYRYLGFAYTYLGFRLDHPFFKDKRVRQAISHAINKKELIDGVLFGLGQEVTGPYKPGHWVYNPDVRKYPHDPAKAKALLAEAGWKLRADGTMEKDGRKFAFTVFTNAGNESRSKTAAIIQQQLAAVGIKMEIRTLEWAAFINEFVKKRKFDALILGWATGPEPDQFDIWSSTKTGPDELNHVGFANAEVDRLLEGGRRTFDMEKRKKAYFRIQEILAEEQPYVFLYAPEALPVFHKRVRGIEPAPAGIGYNFIKWYVPKAEQKYTSYQ